MGNTTSCAPSIISSAGAVKVISIDGKVETYSRPIKAAELMLENPRKFVCDSGDLKTGHRIQGLSADEDLERRRLYFLLPMEMLYSVLTDEEMDYLSYKASKALNKHGGFSYFNNNIGKIMFPILGELYCFPTEVNKSLELQLQKDMDIIPESVTLKLYTKQRSWKPALDTIVETPCRV